MKSRNIYFGFFIFHKLAHQQAGPRSLRDAQHGMSAGNDYIFVFLCFANVCKPVGRYRAQAIPDFVCRRLSNIKTKEWKKASLKSAKKIVMKKYVFEITLTEEDLCGDEMWEEMMSNTNSGGVAELTEALQQSLLGEFTLLPPDADEIAKGAVKLKSFSDND